MWIINEACFGLASRKIASSHKSNWANEKKSIKRNWWST